MNYKVAGVTILYHPPSTVMDHLATYLGALHTLIIVDNSEKTHAALSDEFLRNPKVVYVQNGVNEGVARALNQAAEIAVSMACDFLLTMDQDSSFKPFDLQKMLDTLFQQDTAQIGIMAPVHNHVTAVVKDHVSGLQEVALTMTSGNLLNLKAYQLAGPFEEALFIDHVDHEYCLRLRQRGFRIVENQNILLHHALGYVTEVRMLGISFARFVSHSPLRTYYMIRNGLFVAHKYKPDFPWFYRKNRMLMIKEIGKIIFQDNRLQRLRMVFLGISHYRVSRMGKLEI
jgi:rhamnosyltransferase